MAAEVSVENPVSVSSVPAPEPDQQTQNQDQDDDEWLYGGNADEERTTDHQPEESVPEPEAAEDPPGETIVPLKLKGMTIKAETGVDKADNNDDDEDSDDDVQVTIGDIVSAPAGSLPMNPEAKIFRGAVTAKPVTTTEAEAVQHPQEDQQLPMINGLPIYEFDLETMQEKPWSKPGADITDFFNYGFREDTWKAYCEKQRHLRFDNNAPLLHQQLMATVKPHATVYPAKQTEDFSKPKIQTLSSNLTSLTSGPVRRFANHRQTAPSSINVIGSVDPAGTTLPPPGFNPTAPPPMAHPVGVTPVVQVSSSVPPVPMHPTVQISAQPTMVVQAYPPPPGTPGFDSYLPPPGTLPMPTNAPPLPGMPLAHQGPPPQDPYYYGEMPPYGQYDSGAPPPPLADVYGNRSDPRQFEMDRRDRERRDREREEMERLRERRDRDYEKDVDREQRRERDYRGERERPRDERERDRDREREPRREERRDSKVETRDSSRVRDKERERERSPKHKRSRDDKDRSEDYDRHKRHKKDRKERSERPERRPRRDKDSEDSAKETDASQSQPENR